MDRILSSVCGKCWLSIKTCFSRSEDAVQVHFTPAAEASPETGHPTGHPGLLLLGGAVEGWMGSVGSRMGSVCWQSSSLCPGHTPQPCLGCSSQKISPTKALQLHRAQPDGCQQILLEN